MGRASRAKQTVDIGRHMRVEVLIKTPWHWGVRRWLAVRLIQLAGEVLRCDMSVKTEFVAERVR